MRNAKQTGAYKQIQIKTASPGKLILMLYEGAIGSLKKAIDRLEKKDYGGKGECLMKAQDIVMELNLALDMGAGEVSSSLRRLYLYVYRRLIDANLDMDSAGIKESLTILEDLYEAWKVAVQNTESAPPAEISHSRLSLTG